MTSPTLTEIFNTLRAQGCRAQEAAAVVGLAALARETGWDNLGLPAHKTHGARKMLLDVGVDPEALAGAWAVPGGQNGSLHSGVLTSGRV